MVTKFFPKEFIFGTAVASYQVEGGIYNNDWTIWERNKNSKCEEVCAEAASQAMPAIEAYCLYATGVDCATAGIDECSILTNSDFALGLCGTLAGALTESETCEEWTASFDESWLDAQATAVVGASCTDFAGSLQAGLAAGDATAIATIDGLFAGVAGMTCTDYGNNYVGMCIEGVSGANTMYLMDPTLETWGLFLTIMLLLFNNI